MLQKKVPKWQAWIFLNSKTESKNSISLLLLKDPNYHPVSGHKGLQGSILRQRKGLPLLSHLQILKWEATAFQARVPYQWASIYTYTEKGKRERRRSGGRNTLKSWLTMAASLGWAPLTENRKLLAKFNPTTNTISTPANEVASLKHAVSLFPGCNNTVIICVLTFNHLTVLEKQFSLLCVSATTLC